MPEPDPPQLVWHAGDTPGELRAALETLAEEYPIGEGPTDGLAVRFERIDQPGLCRLRRSDGAAVVQYGSPAAALRAIGSLLAGLPHDGDVLEERSDFATFGIMLDCSRNAVMRPEHLKRWLRRLALLGYNMAMLYTEDTYQLPGEPYFGYQRGAYTAPELKDIDAYAARLGIEMIPCIQTLGHLEQILKWHVYGDVKDTPSVLCVGQEKTYALIEKMLAFWRGVYGADRIHLGMDEAADLGRGKYLDHFGCRRGSEIFATHLAKVVELCDGHGYRPMIWSDPIICSGTRTGGYYDDDFETPADLIAKLPKQVQAVYWDYYSDDVAHYVERIERHRGMGLEPIMGSGIKTGWKLWHDHAATEANAGACIDACRQARVKEIFFTLWGDNGAYCDIDSALAGLAFAAEKAFTASVDTGALSSRFRAVCGADYEAHCLAAEINTPLVAPAALWDDPLLGIYLQSRRSVQADALSDAARCYGDLADRLAEHAGDRAAGNLHHARLLAGALAAKVGLAERLVDAYARKDTPELTRVRDGVGEVADALRRLLASFRAIWLARNKPNGLEVIQVRFGGLLARYQELTERLGEYLDGTVEAIPELEANLPHAPGGIGNTPYRLLATASSHL